ncbi:MAG TPA: hypothetical protein VGE43_19350 [Acidimicrobiales bacterium]
MNSWLDALDGSYVQLHTGDPGAAGTANVATETTRQQISLAAASGGSVSTDTDTDWTGMAATEDPTNFSLWSAPTAGTFRGSGTVTTSGYTSGGDWSIPAGDLTISLPVAS